MAIFNMVGGGGGSQSLPTLDAVSNLAGKMESGKITLTWTDPSDKTVGGTTIGWLATILVRKANSAPTSITDGTILKISTTRNQYQSSGYQDTSVYNNTNYYYAVFAVGNNNTISDRSNTFNVLYRDYLYFTANTAGSTVALNKSGSPTSLTMQTSRDGISWSNYSFGSNITLSNIGDRVFFRNSNGTAFSTSNTNYYYFSMSGNINADGDTVSLLNAGCTAPGTFYYYGFYRLFYGCSALRTAPKVPSSNNMNGSSFEYMFGNCTNLRTAPKLPAQNVWDGCYNNMFANCSNLEQIPELPATTLKNYCYYYMFTGCSKIKISTSQTGEYTNAYRIPKSGTGTDASATVTSMFQNTGGTFKSTPSINTTYYTSNTIV